MAGGKSSRLGRDKVLLPWGEGTLLDHALRRLDAVCGEVRICGDRDDLGSLPGESSPHEDLLRPPVIRDALPGTGPLGGIVAALESTQTTWNFFLAVDLPLVPVEFLQEIAMRAGASASGGGNSSAISLQCVLSRAEGRRQPLCGIYRRSLLPGLRRSLEEGKYKIMLAIENAVAEGLHYAERENEGAGIEILDAESASCAAAVALPASEWFVNINTPEELRRAHQLAAQFQ
jgi:molybdopterin-guanine dinucleotide biosynthesis protein A